MKNKFLTIFLGIIISLFFTNYCLALSAPYNLNIGVVGEGSAFLIWCWDEGGGTIKQFKLLWREETEFGEEDWGAKYPSSVGEAGSEECPNGYIYNYSLRGLAAGTSYEWRVRAEAENSSQDSAYTDGELFTTEASQWEEDPEGENGGGGEGSITIENPFEGIGNIKEAADAFTEFLVITGFAVGPILIIYAAFLLLTKQGNPDAITQAKKIILWTVISLSIMLFAKGIPSVVKNLFK